MNLWEISGLDQDEHYATAYFMYKAQRQQDPEDGYWMTELNSEDDISTFSKIGHIICQIQKHLGSRK